MPKLNLKKDYGVVYGHDSIKYQQDGKDFGGDMEQLVPDKPAPVPVKVQKDGKVVVATPLENAKAFLAQILKENPLSKSAIYKEAENNNHNWEDVKNAALAMNVGRFTSKNLEMWKLAEVTA